MPNVVFKHNNATITVREELGRDVMDAELPFYEMMVHIGEADNLNPDDDMPTHLINRANKIVSIVLRSTVDGDLGFPFPSNVSDSKSVGAFYDALMSAPAKLTNEWIKAIRKSDKEEIDPNATPVAKK